jgi:lysine 6-dehydrogenase
MAQRKSFLVLGAGTMGSAIAFDLARSSSKYSVTIADVDEEAAASVVKTLKSKRTAFMKLKAEESESVAAAMSEHSVTISALPSRYNYQLTKLAVEAGTHFCDLGRNDTVVAEQLDEATSAEKADVCIVANCGLAPGLSNILAMHAFRQMDSIESLQMRVGGLPQNPKPPFSHQLVFSIEGLMEIYSSKAKILRGGKIRFVDPFSDLEELSFPPPFGSMEAFHTGGGTSRLPELLQGKVKTLEYKTIRYKGHCQKMKTLFELGFTEDETLNVGGSAVAAREIFLELLKKRLTFNEKDVVLFSVLATGMLNGKKTKLRYRVIDYYDEETKITSMMRMTGYPVSIIAQMLLNGQIADRGAFTAEVIVPGKLMLEELTKRGINIEERFT